MVTKRVKKAIALRDVRELVLDYVDVRPRRVVAKPEQVVALIEPLLERLKTES